MAEKLEHIRQWDEELPIGRLTVTNPLLNEMYVATLITALKTGEMQPYDLYPIRVRRSGSNNYVTDGNHKVTALKRIGYNGSIFCEVFEIPQRRGR